MSDLRVNLAKFSGANTATDDAAQNRIIHAGTVRSALRNDLVLIGVEPAAAPTSGTTLADIGRLIAGKTLAIADPTRDAGGAPIARIAASDQPLEIALSAGGESAGPGRRAWYQHWYVYAGGAALAAGIGGVIVATTRGPDSGSLPPQCTGMAGPQRPRSERSCSLLLPRYFPSDGREGSGRSGCG